MGEDSRRSADPDRAHALVTEPPLPDRSLGDGIGLDRQAALPLSLLGSAGLHGRGNSPVRMALMQQMQRTYGNRALQRRLSPAAANLTPRTARQTVPGLPIQRKFGGDLAGLSVSGVISVLKEKYPASPVKITYALVSPLERDGAEYDLATLAAKLGLSGEAPVSLPSTPARTQQPASGLVKPPSERRTPPITSAEPAKNLASPPRGVDTGLTPTGASPSAKLMGGIAFLRWKGQKHAEIEASKELSIPSKKLVQEQISALQNNQPAEALDAAIAEVVQVLQAADAAAKEGKVARQPEIPQTGTTDALTRQFDTPSAEAQGGLLMRGTADFNELNMFLSSVPTSDQTPEQLKRRQFNLEKYSYIRGDTTMKSFGGRNFGFLIDWTKVAEHVLAPEGHLAIHAEDAQTGANANPTTAKDKNISAAEVAQAFDGLVTKQNEVKKTAPAKTGNWNEVELLTVTPDAYVGLFYSWPNTKEDYDKLFTETKKSELSEQWLIHTGKKELKIYLYLHQGSQPSRTAKPLGEVGASQLVLMETIEYTGTQKYKGHL